MAKKKEPTLDFDTEMGEKSQQWLEEQLGPAATVCPFCGHTANIEGDTESLMTHINIQHPVQMGMAYAQKSIDPRMAEDVPEEEVDQKKRTLQEIAGVTLQEDLDRPDYLHVPASLRSDIEERGGNRRWVAQDKVDQWVERGAKVVERKGTEMPHGSSADGTVRSREMVLMEISPELAEFRQKIHDRKTDDKLQARVEDLERIQEGREREIYDNLKRETSLDTIQLKQVSKLLARGDSPNGGGAAGDLRYGDPKARQNMKITDRHGEITY